MVIALGVFTLMDAIGKYLSRYYPVPGVVWARYAINVLLLAEASAIAFVLPLFVAVLAVPMLAERLDAPHLIAIVVGLAGVLAVMRPGSAAFTAFALLPLGMALMNALDHILTRKVAGVEPPLTSLFYGSFVGSVMFLPVLPFAWQTPRASTSPAASGCR